MTPPVALPQLPPNACDCHIHFFDDAYPVIEGAHRLPPARPSVYQVVQKTLGTSRVVIVAPSTYGLNNDCLLHGLREMGDQARAVIALDPDAMDDQTLKTWHDAGARGVRFNLARGNARSLEGLHRVAQRIAGLGWHVQVMATPEQLVTHGDAFKQLPTPLVIDHMARIPQDGGIDSAAYPVLQSLLEAGNTYVKLSLASSARLLGSPRESVLHTLGKTLVRDYCDRLLWGSDWPHVLSTLDGTPQPPDTDMLRVMLSWAPGQAQQQAILCDTPAKLYDFPGAR